uniref:Myosin catalytic light chain, smooth muscle1 n=1 Tax=Phallusia mammillata TaxID=59560 RepID=A0A6F9DL09_9ASCI|nr:myosin catalytic light chain, smooth muscle1 [Phallusia mammillata]
MAVSQNKHHGHCLTLPSLLQEVEGSFVTFHSIWPTFDV